VETGGRITLTYWSATNAQELEFANQMAAEWNARHTEVQIKVEPVPSGQSTEEIILAAIASNTAPDIYASVFPGAMQDLLDAQG
ncbi:MAG: extracellular solute-binding protein, partial [Pyrinomonadaceae bacterium]